MSRETTYYDDQSKGGGYGTMAAMKGGVGATAVGTNYLMDRKAEKDAQDKREADAEMKRESRSIPKPANFDAIQEAKQDAADARARKKISDMGYAKGGKVSSASKRADGCATKGKTKGTMIEMCGGGMMKRK
jgi:hypothetical protein